MNRYTQLRTKGKSETAILKEEIQRLVREIVIKRDGGCILRNVRNCGGEAGYTFLEGGRIGKVPGLVLQADHLVTRANSATFDDARLIVCLCRTCHGWKHWHQKEYDALVQTILPANRVRLWEQCERDSWKPTHRVSSDWRISIAALKQELARM